MPVMVMYMVAAPRSNSSHRVFRPCQAYQPAMPNVAVAMMLDSTVKKLKKFSGR